MPRSTRAWILLFAGLLMARPAGGQAKAQVPADTAAAHASGPVGTWVSDVSSWDNNTKSQYFLQTLTIRADGTVWFGTLTGNPVYSYPAGQAQPSQANGVRQASPDTVASTWRREWYRVSGDTMIRIDGVVMKVRGGDLISTN